jgi:retron-type reverse transcriptase
VEVFLEQISDELITNTYQPMPVRKKEIPKDGGIDSRECPSFQLIGYPE